MMRRRVAVVRVRLVGSSTCCVTTAPATTFGRRSRGLERDGHAQRRPTSGAAGAVHRAAERLDAVNEAGESRSFTDIGSPDSVILNREMEIGVVGIDAHVDLGRLCVLGGVGEGFGNDVIGGDFAGFGQPLVDTYR